jgi:hypothetical protein
MADYTNEQLVALRKAFASGVTRVTNNGRSVEYRSLDDMERAIRAIESALSAEGGVAPIRRLRMQTTKGL